MDTFDTLPADIRVEIYEHVFKDAKVAYVPYQDHFRYEGPRPLPSRSVSILFVSRKIFSEAHKVLTDSTPIHIGAIVTSRLSSFQIGDLQIGGLLRHVVIRAPSCRPDGTLYRCNNEYKMPYTVARFERVLSKLPVLRSLRIDLMSPGWKFCIKVSLPEGLEESTLLDSFEPYQFEDAANRGLAEWITGHHCQRNLVRTALRASSLRDTPFTVKTQSELHVKYQIERQGPSWYLVSATLGKFA